MENILKKISEIGIVPVVTIENIEDTLPIAKALYDGGIPCAEVTFRNENCLEAIKIIKETYKDMLLGAGTVSDIAQVENALSAGAEFIVTPGFNEEVVSYCVNNNILIIPGCSNPSDLEKAQQYGLNIVKIFPAESIGGIKLIKSLSAPYNKMKFMPTGGINEENLREYLKFDKIIACGGSWMVPKDIIKTKDFKQIERLVKKAINKMLNFELAHIGINSKDSEDAESIVTLFEEIFGFEKAANPNSIFAGSYIEAMRNPYLGTNGHIGIFTSDIVRAVAYLKRLGVTFNEESAKYDATGRLGAIYLQKEIGKFAVHLVQKK